jgi:hypothetical protein
MAIRSSVDRNELMAWHNEIEIQLARCQLHYISYNVDGVSIERGLGHELHNNAVNAGTTRTWSFKHPCPGQPALIIQAPILANGLPRVVSTDGKHAKKNGRGSATSGARVLAMGNYLVHYGQLADLAQSEGSPLLKADIIGVDKQDDRAGARLFSSAVIEHISRTQPSQIGLAVYLFIMGEIVDAQQSRFLPHSERIKMLWRGRFFLHSWRQHILSHPHYSVNTHFITRELYDILNIFIDGMLTLILIHRDYYPDVPLLLWLHSTEVCEHFFGCARKILPNFTFVEWILMVPKLVLLMMSEMKSKGSQAGVNRDRSGYFHSWFNAKGLDPTNLATFPSDIEHEALIQAAYLESNRLCDIVGIETAATATLEALAPRLAESLKDIESRSHCQPVIPEVTDSDESTPNLNHLLAADAKDDVAGSRSLQVDKDMTNIGIAATAAHIHDTLTM